MHSRCSQWVAVSLAIPLPVAASAQEVRGRELQQQGRIAQGIGSGQITARGAANPETRAGRINASREAVLAANGGHLTRSDYRRLDGREAALSNRI